MNGRTFGGAPARRAAIAQALFVTFLWSTSWVFIKVGLRDLPPLAFAGLRYALAAALLVPLALADRASRRAFGALDRRGWAELAALGLALYAVTQGAQFAALASLPASAVGLVFAFSPLAVALAGAPLLGEHLRPRQWGGVALFLAGALLYLGQAAAAAGWSGGLAIAVLGLAANVGAALLGRAVARRGLLPPLAVTAASMAIGAVALLGVGVAIEGLPRPGRVGWAIVAWLATVNTAFAFTLWNRTLRRLTATESSLINNTMLAQVALLAWLFLDEPLAPQEIAGVVVALAGVAVAHGLPVRTSRRGDPGRRDG